MPALRARCRSSSLRNSSRPIIWPPMHLSAAAASTPSGAPPEPMYMSMPVFCGSAQWMTPATSPSVISRMRAPVARISSISASWRGRSSTQTMMPVALVPLARASAWMRSVGVLSSETTPVL